MFTTILTAALLLAPTLEDFVRIKYNGKEPILLQTAVARYENNKGQIVDLVSVIHIGDQIYYESLNKLFKKYDKVCYELVAPKNHKVTKSPNIIHKFLSTVLGTEHQLDIIDYSPKNFVHADVSPDELFQIIKNNGETPISLLIKVVLESLDNPSTLEIDFANPFAIKRFVAVNLTKAKIPPIMEKFLVTERNKVAMMEVDNQLKNHNSVALFYGAAHMPDFDKRLRDRGFMPKSVTWMNAWDLSPNTQERFFELFKKLIN